MGARKLDSHPIYGLAQAKWQSSGLTDAQADALRLRPTTGQETSALNDKFHPVGALHIPYFDLEGKPTKFYRIRYLEPLPGFAGVVEKPQRYAQAAGTLNEVYFPPILERPWAEIAKDANVKIFVTEGELKAASACAHGLPTFGLGGVDVWRSTKRGIDLLPALKQIEWKNREVVIVYDSDAATNPNVVRAQRQLSQELISRGALPMIASLPPAKDGGKQGLDDFIVAHGAPALERLLNDSPAFPEADALWELNSEVFYVRDPGLIVEARTGQRIQPARFVNDVFANRHYTETSTGKGGVMVFKKKPLARRWLEWEGRFETERMTYAPGKPRIFDGTYNTWPGWAVEPKKGDVSPWKWLLDYIFKSDPSQRDWFERWCAYPLQHPGTKMYTACLIWGRATGTGKSFIAYSLMGIYGRNSIEIKNKDLKGGFNGWAKDRQFVYGDEISGSEARVDADWLKGLVTQAQVRINEKYLPEYVTPDQMNYFFSSNHPDALYMEDTDRRYFVHEVVGDKAERAFYDRVHKWLHGDGPPGSYRGPGASYLFHHLLSLDLKGFQPQEQAPITDAKRNMVLTGKSDVGMWCVQLREDPRRTLAPLGQKIAESAELFTPTALLRAYDPDGSKKVTAPGIARELQRAGIRAINGGGPIRTKGGIVRLYAVRNTEAWFDAKPKKASDHYDAFFGPDAGKK